MMFCKFDYEKGGLIVLEATEFKKIYKTYAIIGWKVIFQYGDIKQINFMLHERQSKKECFFMSEESMFYDLNLVCSKIKQEIDKFVTVAKELKEDNKQSIKDIKKETEEMLAECETEIKRCDKQIRDFSNIDIEREFEKRGLIF